MRRPLLAAAALAALLVPVAAGAVAPKGAAWAKAEIRLVVARGLMADDVAGFRADDALLRGELEQLAAGLAGVEPAAHPRPSEPVTMAQLNARLVRALDLADAGRSFAAAVRAAGLRPTSRFGAEVVARLLGLRKNHAAAYDALERLPGDPATRADAAYSAARVLRLAGWEADAVRAAAGSFAVPDLTPWQRRILRTALSFVGHPYVWGGESEAAEGPYGPQAQGGFDCSGFVWRAYKLQAYPGGNALDDTLRGRTTFAMSAEAGPKQRIRYDGLRPGDLVFFGAKGPRSKPAQIDHMGILVAPGWIVHSSRDGVALTPLEGWYRARFAWGRRPLVEAGLES